MKIHYERIGIFLSLDACMMFLDRTRFRRFSRCLFAVFGYRVSDFISSALGDILLYYVLCYGRVVKIHIAVEAVQTGEFRTVEPALKGYRGFKFKGFIAFEGDKLHGDAVDLRKIGC